MAIFRDRRIKQRGGANAGRGDDAHGVTSGVRNLRYSMGKEAPSDRSNDWADPHGMVRPQNPYFYDWALDPEMNPEHILNKRDAGVSKNGNMDSDIPQAIVDKVLKND